MNATTTVLNFPTVRKRPYPRASVKGRKLPGNVLRLRPRAPPTSQLRDITQGWRDAAIGPEEIARRWVAAKAERKRCRKDVVRRLRILLDETPQAPAVLVARDLLLDRCRRACGACWLARL
jgi:hypothetical protein